MEHRRARRARLQGGQSDASSHRGSVQRVQREHRARAGQQRDPARQRRDVDEPQRAGAEPEPAHRPRRHRGWFLKT